jgi:hypothetical protein
MRTKPNFARCVNEKAYLAHRQGVFIDDVVEGYLNNKYGYRRKCKFYDGD